ncbi:MAG: DUF655 domain-containing protein [Tissierellia bacterium]|nr:DUF655 domain-containing protein [Tissierellia bacterium]
MKENKSKFYLAIIIISLLCISLIIKNKKDNELLLIKESNESINQFVSETEEIKPESGNIYIHLSGQVKFPGLIEIEEGKRLFEAVNKAGGLTDEADMDRINLSIKLSDEQKIYIPKVGEEVTDEKLLILDTDKPSLININTADKSLLMTLPGVGEKTADKIIEYREKQKFKTIEDLKNVPGIGNKKYEELKEQITV